MKDEHKAKEQLINELAEMRRRIAGLEAADAERKRAEESLRESEARYRAIVEDQTELICRFRPNGTLTFVNEAYCRYFGKRREELIGHSCMPLIPEEDREFVWQQMASLSLENPVGNYEHRVVTPSGEIRWQQWTDRAIFDEQGRLVEYQSVGRDITERKRAEEETRRRNRELAALNAITATMMQSALNLKEVLQLTTDGVVKGLGCNTAIIFLLDEKEEIFRVGAVSTKARILNRLNALIGFPLLQVKIPARSDFNDTMSNLLAGRTTIKRDLYELLGPLLSKPVCFAMQRLLDSRTFFTMPLLAKGKTVGGIVASTREELSEEDTETLMTFANQAAITIENARLYEETQQRALQQETLREAALALTTALDRNEVIGRILAQLQQVVPYDSASVQLLQGDMLVLIGGRGFPNLKELLGTSFPVNGDTPNREVMRTLSPFILEDAPTMYEAFTQEPHAAMGIRSWLGVPMLIGQRPVGMITLDKCQPGFYTQEHARLAEAFATQATVAIENARLFEEEKRRATQLALINEVGEKAASILDLDRLMQEVTRSIRESFNYYNVALLLLDEERGEVVLQAVAGGFEHIVPGDYRQSLDEGITGLVAKTGKSRLVSDVSKDSYYVKGFLEEVLTKSELCVPIKLGDRVIGALDVQSIHLNDFDQSDVMAMEAVADRAAIAMENARLYEETRQRATELSTLYEVATTAMTSVHLDEILNRIMAALQEALRPDDIAILLVEPETNELVIHAHTGFRPKLMRRTIGVGIPGWVVQTGQPVLLADVRGDERYRACDPDTRSELCVPLRVGEQIIGALNLESRQSAAFSENDLRLLSILAGHLAAVIQNARLFEDTEHLKAFNESVVQGVAEAILIENAHGILIFANPAAEELLGYTHEELIGQHWTAIVPERQVEKVQRELTKRPQGIESRYETALLSKERQVIPAIVSAQPLLEEGRFVGVLSAFTDIREQVRREREIEERQVYLEGVLRDAPDAIVTLDARHRIAEWNAGAERLFGYSQEEAIGHNLDDLVTNPDVFEEAAGFTQAVLGGKELPPTEAVRYRKDGSPVDVIVAGSPILVGNELIGVVAVYTDITARVRMEETLRALALIDELTGLYNRRGFFTLAEQQLKTADRVKRRMVLLFADFDGLKQINDTLGHPEGDRALIETADILRETFRESDIIARIGGDEFVMLAIETNGSPAEILTARLQENLAARNARKGRRYKLSLSVGLARYDPERPCSIDDLLAQADRAMYERKRGDRKT